MHSYNETFRKSLKEQEAAQNCIKNAIPLLDDKSASMLAVLYDTMQYNGKLIPAKTRINWNGRLVRSAVDIWDTEENNPDNAPALWENIAYRDGFRIIPETITATMAFSKGECGWWGDRLYESMIDGNVYTPVAYPQGWEIAGGIAGEGM